MAAREGGFIVLHRRIKSWSVYRAMRAEQRQVVTEMLLAARWHEEPGEYWFGPHRFEVPRGGYFLSEDELAKEAGTTRKVVRTTYRLLITEGFMTRRAVHSSGQCPHLVTIVNYDKYQSITDEAGQWQGQRRASDGPVTGQRRAPNEPREPREPRELPSAAASAAGQEAGCANASTVPAGPTRETAPITTTPPAVWGEAGTLPPAVPAPANGAAETRHPRRASAAPKSDADPRHAVFIAAAHRLYAAKVPGGNLTVNGKDGTHLRDFLACQPGVKLEQFERVYLAALGLGGKWPGCTRVADVVDRWTDLLALSTGPPVKANGGIRGHGRRWWEDLDEEQREAFMRERHELAPELDAAPLDVAGEVGRERKDVLALLARWRALAERRAMA